MTKESFKPGGYRWYQETLKAQSETKVSKRLSYLDSADKQFKTSPSVSGTVSSHIGGRFSILKPRECYMPVEGDVDIFAGTKINLQVLSKYLSNFSGVLSLDIETKGTQAASEDCLLVGIGLADANQICYVDILNTDHKVKELVYSFLKEYQDKFIMFNSFFDNTFLLRELGTTLEMEWDAYGLYKQLATEGFLGQKWGLKDAQVQLLEYPDRGDFLLEKWLVENDYRKSVSKEYKPGYFQYVNNAGSDRWCKGDKAEMWRAPPEILGHYCGVDAASTWQLVYHCMLPSIQDQSYSEAFIKYHKIYLMNVKHHCHQQLSGITVDRDMLTSYYEDSKDSLVEDYYTFIENETIRPLADLFNKLVIDKYTTEHPMPKRYKKQKPLGDEPSQYTRAGVESKTWANWCKKRDQRIAEGAGVESKVYLSWMERVKAMGEMEHLNLNSGPQLEKLFYEMLEFPMLVRTESGAGSTGVEALPGFGELGILLKNYKDRDKLLGYMKGCLNSLIPDSSGAMRLHPQFRMPGTLTCRLAGSGGVNVQQLPKDKGYLDCFRPVPGKVWIDNDHCLTDDHEILTRDNGWVNILKVTKKDYVWQVDKFSREGTWIHPSRVIKKDYDGMVYSYGNSRGSIRVTDKHRMLFVGQQTKEDAKDKTWEGLGEEGILNTNMSLPINTTSLVIPKTGYKNKAAAVKDIWMSCLLHADGCYNLKKDTYRVEVAKLRKRRKVRELLGVGRGTVRSRRDGIRIDSEIWTNIKHESKLLTVKSFNNLDCLSKYVDEFVDALGFWDGHVRESGRIIWGSVVKEEAEKIQSFLVRNGYEAKMRVTTYRDSKGREHYQDYYTLSIFKRRAIRLTKDLDFKAEKYKGKVGCVTVPSSYFLCRRAGQTFVTGNCALEMVVLAELSKDPALYSLYGKGAKANNDVYIYNGSIMARDFGIKLFQPFLDEGYIPENPNPEAIKQIKKKHKKLRGISKAATLGKGYGMGWNKFKDNMALQGVILSENEARAVISGLDNVYAGVKTYTKYLEKEYTSNNGWIVNGIGRPVGCDKDYIKDILNRCIQSTGHDLHMIYVYIIYKLFEERGIKVNGLVIDFHDQSIVECDEKDAEAVYNIMGYEAYTILNKEYLQGDIDLKGDPQYIRNFADAKIEEEAKPEPKPADPALLDLLQDLTFTPGEKK